MYATMETVFLVAAAAICCFAGLRMGEVQAQSFEENANFEAESYYPMLRRHWSKFRQINPSARNLISIPVPRAGKRSDTIQPLAASLGQPEAELDNTSNSMAYTDYESEATAQRAAAAAERAKNKKFWPKYWTSFVKSPIYWPGSQRPYWRL